MIEPMAKLRLVCPRSLLDQVTAVLQEEGVLHIEAAPREPMEIPLRRQVMDEPARQRQAELERLRGELRRLLQLLPQVSGVGKTGREGAASPEVTEEVMRRMAHVVRLVGSRVDYLTGRLKEYEEEFALLSKYKKAVEALAPFLRLTPESEQWDYLGVTIEAGDQDTYLLSLLREMLGMTTENRYRLFHARLDSRSLAVLLVVPKEYAARIRELLCEEGINELRLPASVSDKPFEQALQIILKKKRDLPATAKRYREVLEDLAAFWRQELEQYLEAVQRRLEQLEAESFFYRTEMASFIYGWVPRRALKDLTAKIETAFGGKAVVEECPIGRDEWVTVPVVLKNPPVLRPFEALTRLIALPRYGSIDPTPYLAVFFPLFYGIILGDAGYGLLLGIATLFVRRRYRHVPLIRDLTMVFFVASIAAILFGLLFGEVFGELAERVGLHPVLNRMEAFLPLFCVSVAVGTLHVSLGMVLGALWAWRQGARQAALAKLAGLLLVFSFVCIIAGLAGLLPRDWVLYGLVGFILSLTLVFGFGGARGVLELHSLVNVLSYLRLMGVGVASAALAFAANKLGGMAGNLLLTIVVAGTLHAINLVFGVLSPTIQSLRLQYVEFFESFFAPGGSPYKPFSRGARGR